MVANKKWKFQKNRDQVKAYRITLSRAMGYEDAEFERPLIGVIHGWGEMGPGEFHLRSVAEACKSSIRSCGGTPIELIVPGLCAGMSSGTYAARYSLPYRDFAAGLVEILLEEYFFDGAVVIPSCDYTIPAYLMGISKVNIPSIVVTGGYMDVGSYLGKPLVMSDIVIAHEARKAGKISTEQFNDMVDCACPSPGECPLMGTASTLCVISESLGISLPGNATTPATGSKLLRLAKRAGSQILKLVERDIKPSDILKSTAFRNAITVVLAVGGSMNAVIHLTAIAKQLDIEISLDIWDEISSKTPLICRVMPNHPTATLRELEAAGGVPSIMKQLSSALEMRVLTATGKSLGENLENVKVTDTDFIRPLSNPYRSEGGIAVLRGNLAPDGAVIKASAVPPEMIQHTGPAVVYDSEEEAVIGLEKGDVHPGNVVVIRYEGPRGGPGAREPMMVMHSIVGLGLMNSVALISDSRFSGTNKGCLVGHITPEAAEGGPLSIVQNGDLIEIDIPQRKLNIKISETEMENRLKSWKAPDPKERKGVLGLYHRSSASLSAGGGILV